MKRCDECRQLATTVEQDGRTLCCGCAVEPPSWEDAYIASQYPALKENVVCLRCVENRDRFELLFVTAASNRHALALAVVEFDAANVIARPVER
jgi:hypothetical protein